MITVTPIIDLTKSPIYVFRLGTTGSMVATNFNDVWTGGGIQREKEYAPYVNGDKPAGVDMYISCEKAGATNRIYINGLDGNGHFQEEEKNLNGQNRVLLSKQYFRIFDIVNMENSIVPTTPGDPNRIFAFRETTVTVGGTPTNLTKIEAVIPSFSTHGFCESKSSHFTVPFNMRGYIESYEGSANYATAENRAIFYLMRRHPGREILPSQTFAWEKLAEFALNTSGVNAIDVLKNSKNNKGIPLQPGDDIKMLCFVDATINVVSASIDIRLEKLQ